MGSAMMYQYISMAEALINYTWTSANFIIGFFNI